MLSAIVGINWGDEGKGRMVDLLGSGYDVVVRYQGGNNAGHTVINDKGKFVLNLLPSGILREDTVNVMGVGMVVDIEHLCGEMRALEENGVRITPDNLKISDKATICFPYHRQLDILEEERLGDRQYGSTRRGIAPVYADKYMHKGIRIGDLLFAGTLRDKIANILEWKNLMIAGGYGKAPVDPEETLRWLERFGEPLIPYICDATRYLSEAANSGKDILFEAQLGALRDIDYGIHPYTTSSQTLAAYAVIGAGVPGAKLDRVIGVIKAYSSSVGGGPFVTEMDGAEAEALREAGGEYGAATGRPRRVGAFDVPASRYGVKTQGADCLALTKLDVLAYMDQIPICVAYEVHGKRTENFPTGDELSAAKPIYEYAAGFKQNISKCRNRADLPKAAADYIRYIEEAVGCEIRYVSVGPKREDYIDMSR